MTTCEQRCNCNPHIAVLHLDVIGRLEYVRLEKWRTRQAGRGAAGELCRALLGALFGADGTDLPSSSSRPLLNSVPPFFCSWRPPLLNSLSLSLPPSLPHSFPIPIPIHPALSFSRLSLGPFPLLLRLAIFFSF